MGELVALAMILALPAFAAAQPDGNAYVGSKACFGCHSSIYKSFQKTDMGRSIVAANDWHSVSLPEKITVPQPGTSRSFSISSNGLTWLQGEAEPDVFSVDHPLSYAVGSGSNGVTFLIRRGRFLFQAPLSYYSRIAKWDLSPGYETVDLGFSRVVPEECINCHAGRPSPIANLPGAYSDPPFQELAIGCENCHGPGVAHVNAPAKSKASSIVNPAKLNSRLADNICMSCHQSGDARVTQPGKSFLDFRPGEWLFDTAIILKQPAKAEDRQSDLLEHFSAMQASRCFRESAGKLSCLTCHDPHVQPAKEDLAAYYRPKCLTCHGEADCKLPLATRQATAPGDNCIGCHMPKRDVLQISHSALTNHRIPARSDEQMPPLQQEQHNGLVVVNPPDGRPPLLSKPQLLRAYRQMAAKNPDYQPRYFDLLDEFGKSQSQDPTIQAMLGDRALKQDKNDEAVEHLKLSLAQANPAIYLELAQALAKLGRNEEAIEYLKKGVELDPYNAVMQKTLILQYINGKAYPEARSLMQQYVTTFPEDSLMRSLLARVSK